MPIFNVLQIDESHLARIRAYRANNILEEWEVKSVDLGNTHGLSFNQWKRYIRKCLSSKETPSYISTSIVHRAD
jgi:hypothetical protein